MDDRLFLQISQYDFRRLLTPIFDAMSSWGGTTKDIYTLRLRSGWQIISFLSMMSSYHQSPYMTVWKWRFDKSCKGTQGWSGGNNVIDNQDCFILSKGYIMQERKTMRDIVHSFLSRQWSLWTSVVFFAKDCLIRKSDFECQVLCKYFWLIISFCDIFSPSMWRDWCDACFSHMDTMSQITICLDAQENSLNQGFDHIFLMIICVLKTDMDTIQHKIFPIGR